MANVVTMRGNTRSTLITKRRSSCKKLAYHQSQIYQDGYTQELE